MKSIPTLVFHPHNLELTTNRKGPMAYLDLVSLGKRQIEYPDPEECEFCTQEEYIKSARKIISHFAPRFGDGLAAEMLASEDAVANVVTALAFADWRWNEDYQNTSNTKRDKYSYRNQCGLWAIKGYISRKHKSKNKGFASLDRSSNGGDSDRNSSLYTSIEDESASKELNRLEDEEHSSFISSKLQALLGSGILTEQQRNFIELHYLESKPMTEIAEDNNVSREAVRQVIDRGIGKLQELVQNYG